MVLGSAEGGPPRGDGAQIQEAGRGLRSNPSVPAFAAFYRMPVVSFGGLSPLISEICLWRCWL